MAAWTVLSINLGTQGYLSKVSILATTYAYPQSPSSFSGDDNGPIIPGDDISDADDEKHARDAIVSINGIPHYMLVGGNDVPSISRQFAKQPVTVQTAEILRAPPNFGCFMVNTPKYLSRAYAEKLSSGTTNARDNNGNGDEEEAATGELGPESRQEFQTDKAGVAAERPSSPVSSFSLPPVSFEGSGSEKGEGNNRDPVISQSFYSSGSQMGSSSLTIPFDDAIILTCFIMPDISSYHAAEHETSSAGNEGADFLLAWLEFASSPDQLQHPSSHSKITPLLTMDMFVEFEPGVSTLSRFSEWDPRYHGYGSLQYIPYRRYRGVFGERRVGEKYVGQGLTLERAAIVHDPSTIAAINPVAAAAAATAATAADLGDDAGSECLIMGSREDERGDRSAEDYFLGHEKGVLYMNKPLVGSFTNVNGIICYEGRRADGFGPKNLDG